MKSIGAQRRTFDSSACQRALNIGRRALAAFACSSGSTISLCRIFRKSARRN
jgi:hypothetical protein